VASHWTVDVRAMLDPDHEDPAVLLVDGVDDGLHFLDGEIVLGEPSVIHDRFEDLRMDDLA
jgi:hypothetical protein